MTKNKKLLHGVYAVNDKTFITFIAAAVWRFKLALLLFSFNFLARFIR